MRTSPAASQDGDTSPGQPQSQQSQQGSVQSLRTEESHRPDSQGTHLTFIPQTEEDATARLSTELLRAGLGWKSPPHLSPGSSALPARGCLCSSSSPCFQSRDGKPRDEGKSLIPSDAQQGKNSQSQGPVERLRCGTAPVRPKGN